MIKKCEMCGVEFNAIGRAKFCPACRYDALVECNQRYYNNNRDKILAKRKVLYQKKKLEAAK